MLVCNLYYCATVLRSMPLYDSAVCALCASAPALTQLYALAKTVYLSIFLHTFMQEYLYKLQLSSRLHDEQNWTEADNGIVAEHFGYLQKLLAEGNLILAGRTLNELSNSMGIAIFRANSEEEARSIMESDPAVQQGIMTAELYPYKVAVQEKSTV